MNNQNSITDTEKNIEILSNIKEDLKNNISHITSYHDKSEHMDLISQAVSTNPKIDYIFDIIISYYNARIRNDRTTCKTTIFQLLNCLKNIDYVSDNFYNHCESPIENLLYTALTITRPEKIARTTFIRSQVPVCNQKYILDMAICTFFDHDYDSPYKILTGIECDGYEFHHNTQEKSKRTNERINDIKMFEKIEIFQYDGKSIYENCIEIANNIWEYVISKFEGDVILGKKD